MPVKVFLWTAPRCISTAFERSIMEVKGSKVFHEPFSKCYHWGPERQSPRYSLHPVDYNASYKDMEKLLTKEYDGLEVIFSKDMAYAIENHFEILLSKELRKYQHTFLIRNPKRAIPSLYKASINKQLTGWEYFDPNEAGFKQMYELYNFLKRAFGLDPVVIDADDLLVNPEETMKAYATATGIPFDESILSWQPGHCPDWETWNGWHENALKSSGFTKQREDEVKKCEDLTKFPTEVQKCIEENMGYYLSLKNHKLNPCVHDI